MTPIALHNDALREVMAAATLVPVECRTVFLTRVAQELRQQQVVGPGNVHRLAFKLARELVWDAGQEAP